MSFKYMTKINFFRPITGFILSGFIFFSLNSLAKSSITKNKIKNSNQTTSTNRAVAAQKNQHSDEVLQAVTKIDAFSTLQKLDLNQIPQTIDILKLIVWLDPYDKSRSAPQLLAESYFTNKKIYLLAAEKLTASEKIIIKEIFQMLESLYQNGQG